MASESKTTTDHDEIRRWAEARAGRPASVKPLAHKKYPGVLRIDFPDRIFEESLEPISWDAWFGKFEKNHLAFFYQEYTSEGQTSRCFKLMPRPR